MCVCVCVCIYIARQRHAWEVLFVYTRGISKCTACLVFMLRAFNNLSIIVPTCHTESSDIAMREPEIPDFQRKISRIPEDKGRFQ